ncbi:calcyclin binding protein, putative [Plasmodium gallinaceum]|uniref:Calcyclin binding protein, putative n=1 Tax=Plasmodium gallinaceum TaxID=5849 RepID=A0A1J1H012_PLAGA|nr:calcyclin binding protein, putative [Plasmodium gallinaceum]CRG96882.1 calcyclin binding protein, putative [Plasmodium gallinaceum]
MDNEYCNLDNIFSNTKLNELNKLRNIKLVVNDKIIRHDWSQTSDNIFFTIYRKNIQKNDFLYYIENDYIFLTIIINEEEIYVIENFLFSKILPSKTKINITPMKVEITFEKEIKELKWNEFIKIENSINLKKKENILNPFSGKSTEEWNKLTKSIKEDDDEGSIDSFFRKIYNEGDDDTKRAMIKSFQTSCGTVLSTNWKDVQNKNYEKEISPNGQK